MSGDGELTILNIAPGINKDVTEYAAEGFWVSCDKVRWQDGKAEKMGGNVIEQTVYSGVSGRTTFHGVARDIITWKGLDGVKYLSVGTHEKLEILTGGKIYDITPIRAITTATSIFNTSAGSTEVVVSLPAHGAQQNDYVIFATIATIATNVSIGGEYQIKTVVGADSYIISVNNTAAITTAAVGGSVVTSYLLGTGLQSNGQAFGWGASYWGRGGWGTPASTGLNVKLSQWSLDNYGQDLLACRKGGYLYRWSASVGTAARASVVSAAPTVNNIIMMHRPTRHVLSFGCTDELGVYDPLLVRWSEQENVNNWTATVTNTAGSYPLQGGNEIVAVVPSRRETLILTDDPVHAMRYTGREDVFAFEQVGQKSGAVSQHCGVDVDGVVHWMGLGAFYEYAGVVKPKDGTVDKYIFDEDSAGSLNYGQKEKVFAGTNALFTEVIWLYPSRDSIEIDSYVIHNYTDNTWYTGTMSRTVWEDIGVYSRPYAVSPTGGLYSHENGKNNDAATMPAYLESGWFDIDDGTDLLFIDRFIPDIRELNGKSLELTLKVRKYPNSPETITKGPYTIVDSTGKVSLRARGRQVKIILQQDVYDGSFELGNNRVAIQPDGKR